MLKIALALIVLSAISLWGCGADEEDVLSMPPEVVQPPTTNPPTFDKPKTQDTPDPVVIAEEKRDDPAPVVNVPEQVPAEIPEEAPDDIGGLDIGGLPVAEGHILYVSGGDKNGTYLMNANGTNQQSISNEFHEYPVLSPDMQMIAYTEGQGKRRIFVRSVDGNRVFQLTGGDMKTTLHPDWSPDGTKIAYSNEWNIFVMNANGLNITKITPGDDGNNNISKRTHPSWSPDGRRIAYVDNEGDAGSGHNIHAINVDGTNRIRLTNNPAAEEYPDWSFDGDYIAYNSHRFGSWDVFIVNVHTFEETQLTDGQGQAGYRIPTWSPDSQQIAFSSCPDHEGAWDIYVINKDGTGLTNLTNSPHSHESAPDWR